MDNFTTLPMDWKPLVEAATAEACKLNRAMYGGLVGVGLIVPLEAAMRVCLADLTRRASRDFWARWLAERVGLTVGATATAPAFYREHHRNGWEWCVEARTEFGMRRVMFAERGDGWDAGVALDHLRIVPGISTLTAPAAALRAALLAVEPA